MGKQLKPHQLRLEPNPPLRPKAVVVAHWQRNQWRLGGQTVRQRQATPDGGMAWSTQEHAPDTWIVFTAAEWARIQALPARVVKPQPAPAPIIAPEQFTLQLTACDTGADWSIQRLTDSLFMATHAPDQPRIVLGFSQAPAATVEVQTADGGFQLSGADYARLLAMPAWKRSMTYARRADSYAQTMRDQAFALAMAQVLPVLVDGLPGDVALAARVMRQVRIPAGACPIEWLARVPLPMPAFLRASGPPPILDPPPNGPDPPNRQLPASLPALTLAEGVSQFAAAVRQQRERERLAALAQRQAADGAREQHLALERQRDHALAQLVLPEQIERTLELLVYLNRWAKERDRLLYADRQGLYAIKAAIIGAAWAALQLVASGFIAGDFAPFAELDPHLLGDVLLDQAANAEWNVATAAPELARLIAATSFTASDKAGQLGAAICACLAQIEHTARAAGMPIAPAALRDLGLSPADLPACAATRWSWGDLDAAELGFLDPEQRSLISFDYGSPTAHFTFHLPFRLAQRFLPAALVGELRAVPSRSREAGERFGRPVNAEERQNYPLVSILQQLGLPTALYLPHGLRDKTQVVAQRQALRWEHWRTYEDEDWDDQFDL